MLPANWPPTNSSRSLTNYGEQDRPPMGCFQSGDTGRDFISEPFCSPNSSAGIEAGRAGFSAMISSETLSSERMARRDLCIALTSIVGDEATDVLAIDAGADIGGMSIRSELLGTASDADVPEGPSGGNGSIQAAESREFDPCRRRRFDRRLKAGLHGRRSEACWPAAIDTTTRVRLPVQFLIHSPWLRRCRHRR